MGSVLGCCLITLGLHVRASPSSPHFQNPLAVVKPTIESQLIETTAAVKSRSLLVFAELRSHHSKRWLGILFSVRSLGLCSSQALQETALQVSHKGMTEYLRMNINEIKYKLTKISL